MSLPRPRLPLIEQFKLRTAADCLVFLHNEQEVATLLDSLAPAVQDCAPVLALREAIRAKLQQRWNRGLQLAQRHIQANPHDAKGRLYLADKKELPSGPGFAAYLQQLTPKSTFGFSILLSYLARDENRPSP